MANEIIKGRGSIQSIENIPLHYKNIYKTAWELKQKSLVDLARDRGFYICQSQSLNLFFENPNYELLTKAHMYTWECGLKTGSYYIRSKPAITSQQFTVNPDTKQQNSQQTNTEPEICETCSS